MSCHRNKKEELKAMTDPRSYLGKKVNIVDVNENMYTGIVDSYAYAKDNDGVDAITLSCGVWLDWDEIESIEIIDLKEQK